MKDHASIGATGFGAESHGALYAELEQQEEQRESALACTPTQAARFSEAVGAGPLRALCRPGGRGNDPHICHNNSPHDAYLFSTIHVFTPPKPKELLAATSIRASRAWLATKLMSSHCGSITSMLILGAIKLCSIIKRQ
jgi:hypothetical protein